MKTALALLLILSQSAFARDNCYPTRRVMALMSFTPEEKVSEAQRDQVFRTLNDIYAQEVAAEGSRLHIFETSSMEFGAWASRSAGVYEVEGWRGVRFHKLMTEDAYALILCHEIGHHLGRQPLKSFTWAAAEGQSDYFGNLKCFRRYLERQGPTEQSADLLSRCAQTFTQPTDIQICARSLNAGRVLGHVLADLEGMTEPNFPSLDRADPTVVRVTSEGHPPAQCRLDTYRAGALCPVAWGDVLDRTDVYRGVCHLSFQSEHRRPACWFAN